MWEIFAGELYFQSLTLEYVLLLPWLQIPFVKHSYLGCLVGYAVNAVEFNLSIPYVTFCFSSSPCYPKAKPKVLFRLRYCTE